MKDKAGFTLIELMIVVAVIVVIASIAIPNMIRSRMTANETSAISSMRTISTGETAFQAAAFADADGNGEGDYGTLPQLANPDGGGATEPFIDPVLGTGTKQGYAFVTMIVAGGPAVRAQYGCTAVPIQSGQTGYRQFFVDDTGVIRFTNDGTAATVASTPLN